MGRWDSGNCYNILGPRNSGMLIGFGNGIQTIKKWLKDRSSILPDRGQRYLMTAQLQIMDLIKTVGIWARSFSFLSRPWIRHAGIQWKDWWAAYGETCLPQVIKVLFSWKFPVSLHPPPLWWAHNDGMPISVPGNHHDSTFMTWATSPVLGNISACTWQSSFIPEMNCPVGIHGPCPLSYPEALVWEGRITGRLMWRLPGRLGFGDPL